MGPIPCVGLLDIAVLGFAEGYTCHNTLPD